MSKPSNDTDTTEPNGEVAIDIHQEPFEVRLVRAFNILRGILIGYDDILMQAMLALVTREHILWEAPPGRAKSFGAELIFGLFDDAKRFSLQLTGDTAPEQVFGNLVVNELLEEGRERRNLTGGICDVEFAFLDEFLDAPDYLLRALLNVLNERIHRTKDQGDLPVPLLTAIGTTNFRRPTKALEAVMDRILAKAFIPDVPGLVDQVAIGDVYLAGGGKQFNFPELRIDELVAFVDHVESPDGVYVSPGMQAVHMMLIQAFSDRRYARERDHWLAENSDVNPDDAPTKLELGLEVTQRTAAKLYDFIRASAALQSRNAVELEDLRASGFGLCVLHDGSGDEGVWKQVCDDLLDISPRELEELEHIGELFRQVTAIKSDMPGVSKGEYLVGGVAVVSVAEAAAKLRMFVFNTGNSVTVKKAQEALAKAIEALDRDDNTTGFKMRGW